MFAFTQNRDPAKTSLCALETEKLKQTALIVHRHTPFVVMVRLVQGIIATPPASLVFNGLHRLIIS
jgi:hypothetical protein